MSWKLFIQIFILWLTFSFTLFYVIELIKKKEL